MGKNKLKYVSNIVIVGDVTPPIRKKANIIMTDRYNASHYKNEEIVIPRNIMEQIYHIPSSIKREWGRMSKAEKIVYGTIFASTVIGLGIAADYKYNDGKTVKSVKEKILSKSSSKSVGAAPAAVVANATAVATPQAVETPYQFTPDLNVHGSPEYVKQVQDSLEEIRKTPDSFRINGRTAYEYVKYYLDELYEGEENQTPKYSPPGVVYIPKRLISPTNLIHIPDHIEQSQNKTFLNEKKKWEERGENGVLFMEYDAIKLQVSWEKARYNLTDEQARNSFVTKMKYYTDDPKYLSGNLSTD